MKPLHSNSKSTEILLKGIVFSDIFFINFLDKDIPLSYNFLTLKL